MSIHGGDIYRNPGVLDFSANCNCYGMPASVREAAVRGVQCANAYPDPECEALREAIADGVDVFGYAWWGPIDLISSGTSEMTKRYGMIYVDQDDYGKGTGKRLRKKSFYYYKKLIASNGADLENDVTIPEE